MNIKKILFIVPPAFTYKKVRDINPIPPLGLGYLASIVERMGLQAEIVDALMLGWDHEEECNNGFVRVGLSDRAIDDAIKNYDPDVVGISCQFSRQYRIYHQMLSVIKSAKPDCITVAGGAHVTACPEEVLADRHCDYVLLGEAEESFRELLEAFLFGRDVAAVDGIGWKTNGQMKINEKNKWIADIDSLPMPAYHIIQPAKYYGLKASHGTRHRNRFCPIVTSRGCPAKCTFCSAHKVWGNKYRMRSVENVIAEMKLLKTQYGIEEIMFEDDNVTAHRDRAKTLFGRMIDESLNFVWDTPNGVGAWSIDEDMLDLMKASGCVKLNLPVESGSQHILNNIINKPVDLSKIRKIAEYCRKIKLDYGMFLVMGMPGETLRDIWSSFRYAAGCGCYSPHISVATPYPGTKLYGDCERNGLFAREYSFDDLFIRSFMIRTSDWDEKILKRMLLAGRVYLALSQLSKEPGSFFKKVARRVWRPVRAINALKATPI